MENNNNGDKIKKWIYNEVSLVISIIAIAIACVLFITGPDADLKQDIALIQQDLNIIKTNHLVHIEQAIHNNTINSEENTTMINEINLKLERIITLLEN